MTADDAFSIGWSWSAIFFSMRFVAAFLLFVATLNAALVERDAASSEDEVAEEEYITFDPCSRGVVERRQNATWDTIHFHWTSVALPTSIAIDTEHLDSIECRYKVDRAERDSGLVNLDFIVHIGRDDNNFGFYMVGPALEFPRQHPWTPAKLICKGPTWGRADFYLKYDAMDWSRPYAWNNKYRTWIMSHGTRDLWTRDGALEFSCTVTTPLIDPTEDEN